MKTFIVSAVVISVVIIAAVAVAVVYQSLGSCPVPRVIWQTCPARSLNVAKVRDGISTWKKRNPHWTHHLHDDEGIRRLVATHMPPAYLRAFDAYPIGVMRADVWRYLVLYVYGGVYADVDAICRRPIDAWFRGYPTDTNIVIGVENDHALCQWTIASRPGHPALRAVLDIIVQRALQGPVDTSNEHFVHHYTGPGVWTEAVATTLGMDPTSTGKEIHDAALTDPIVRERAKRLGIVLVSRTFYQGINVRHNFGSTSAEYATSKGYVSWRKERDAIIGSPP